MNSTIDLKLAAEILGSQAMVLIKGRFEDVPLPMRLQYHDTVHTYGVRERAVAIALAIGLPDREVVLTDIAAAFHDTVQAWHPVDKGNGIIIRQRHAGQNEVTSAQEAVNAMSGPFAPFTFLCEEYGIVASAIIATIPAWSVEHGTVIQPFLTPCSHPVARAVALADIGSPGMDSAGFAKDAPALFAEEQLDVIATLAKADRADDIDEATQEQYRSRYINWLKSQHGFACGRRALLGKELEGLSADARIFVSALFSHFDESIEAAEVAHRRAQTMDFVPLMRQILPQAFPCGVR